MMCSIIYLNNSDNLDMEIFLFLSTTTTKNGCESRNFLSKCEETIFKK